MTQNFFIVLNIKLTVSSQVVLDVPRVGEEDFVSLLEPIEELRLQQTVEVVEFAVVVVIFLLHQGFELELEILVVRQLFSNDHRDLGQDLESGHSSTRFIFVE